MEVPLIIRVALLLYIGATLGWYFSAFSPAPAQSQPSVRRRPRPPPQPQAAAIQLPAHRSVAVEESNAEEKCKALKALPLAEITPSDISNCEQDNPLVWAYILHHHVTPPPPATFPNPYGSSPQPQGNIISKIWRTLHQQTKAKQRGQKIFAEAGANDGVADSNTGWLEQALGWTGVLIECHPEVLPTLHARHRNAYIVDACLSKTTRPATATLTSVDGWHYSSSLANGSDGDIFPDFAKTFTTYEVQTMPLFAILAALKLTEVDFFSLDIQSLEPYVLRNFPFHLVKVRVWVVEVVLLQREERDDLIGLMESNGYVLSALLPRDGTDLVFIHGGT